MSMASGTLLIKICGITTIEDGQAAVDAGANALGFNFYPKSPRYVTPQQARRLTDEITGEYLRVGVFVNAEAGELLEVVKAARLDVVQLHGTLPSSSLPPGLRVWRAVAADALPVPSTSFEAYLLDTPSTSYGGTGISFDWKVASSFAGQVIVAGGLHSGNVAEAIAVAKPAGVDSCSQLEVRPGRKDPALVKAFIREALAAHRALPDKETMVTV